MELVIHKKAKKELLKFSIPVQDSFLKLMRYLRKQGYLEYPDSRKLSGHSSLFEMRVKVKSGIFRGFYCYIKKNEIGILRFFQKKTNKTPLREIHTALTRIKNLV